MERVPIRLLVPGQQFDIRHLEFNSITGIHLLNLENNRVMSEVYTTFYPEIAHPLGDPTRRILVTMKLNVFEDEAHVQPLLDTNLEITLRGTRRMARPFSMISDAIRPQISYLENSLMLSESRERSRTSIAVENIISATLEEVNQKKGKDLETEDGFRNQHSETSSLQDMVGR